MKKVILAILCLLCAGCAYNQITITANSGSTVNCTGSVDKPVDVGTTLQGNVPLNASTVSNPSQLVQKAYSTIKK